ncbi:acetyl xylan esterase [Polaribacter haliotis]|uniref:Acetyl xylan esterase n=1 Tax=Polaribacter haliotis TaxID=1888915 RepID=A0A7L8AGT7_9FLAO|nr:sialate O-acetylesterase [Polaribacter haliotis]QOD61221.1 acetyl xylan esterase [Polaribacter haliotis]
MKLKSILCIVLITLLLNSCDKKENQQHLFILSGQSNMARLNPDISFTPAVKKAFGENNVTVVKYALGTQPIKRWYKNWKPLDGEIDSQNGNLYDTLMVKVNKALKTKNFDTVTFIWMQGERDARTNQGNVYEESLLGLYNQLSKDLGRTVVNFVIGRLCDFDMKNERYPDWTLVREAQVKVAESQPNFAWINTDDLNDGIIRNNKEIKNDLHMSENGYKIMGERFAEKSVLLIKKEN